MCLAIRCLIFDMSERGLLARRKTKQNKFIAFRV
jgi:hypothetical protein